MFVFRNATKNQILQLVALALIARATWIHHPTHMMEVEEEKKQLAISRWLTLPFEGNTF